MAAVKEWEGPANQGDADAQFNLGQAYKWGKGVKQDLKKAELYFGKAASQGHPAASDNYGLLLFDRGERIMAMPYVKVAAGRGDARAQYLLAIAHFNGDQVPKDWVRAYALMTLARTAGLPQAISGVTQMDGFIPLDQRQQAVGLAQQIAAETEANRNRQLAASDLGVPNTPLAQIGTSNPAPASPVAVRQQTPEEAVAAAERVASSSSPRTAGADYARPQVAVTSPRPVTPPPPKPIPSTGMQVFVPSAPKPVPPKPVAAPTKLVVAAVAAAGRWRLQFGAFGVAANADALWAKLKARPEVAGHQRLNVTAGAVTKLQAGGYSEEAARAACAKLSGAGFTCVAVKG